jgi:predicted RNA-binding Zn-ribbon protein involved in translation (DUF1610 family)
MDATTLRFNRARPLKRWPPLRLCAGSTEIGLDMDKKMICPSCGAEMNHHALKINYGAAESDPRLRDEELGGALEEAHSCPQCGQAGSRIRLPPTASNDR